jgi:hypothetical protein
VEEYDPAVSGSDFYTVQSLYPILGSQLVLICLPFLYFYLKDSAAQRRRAGDGGCGYQPPPPATEAVQLVEEANRLGPRQRLGLLALIATLYFLFSGMEVSFRSYISTFTVAIGHSRQTGSGKGII